MRAIKLTQILVLSTGLTCCAGSRAARSAGPAPETQTQLEMRRVTEVENERRMTLLRSLEVGVTTTDSFQLSGLVTGDYPFWEAREDDYSVYDMESLVRVWSAQAAIQGGAQAVTVVVGRGPILVRDLDTGQVLRRGQRLAILTFGQGVLRDVEWLAGAG